MLEPTDDSNVDESDDEVDILVDTCLILMNLNLRYESPIYNIKFKKIFKNRKLLIFNFGSYSYYDYFSLGCDYFSFFKNFISSINFFFLDLKIIFYLGTTFFQNNNKILNILLFFKNFFYKIFNFFVYFNYVTSLANRVLIYDLNILNQSFFFKFNYFNFNPMFFYNIDLNYYAVDNILLNKASLIIYHGHHSDNFIKYSNLVLPGTVFIERPDLLVNSEGYFKIFFYNYFKYFLDTIKDVWSTILIFSKFLCCFFTDYTLNNILLFLNKVSPIFYNKNNNNFIFENNFLIFYSDFFYELSGFFYSIFNNYYLDDSISKHSLVMSVCSKKYVMFNDFKNFFNNLWF